MTQAHSHASLTSQSMPVFHRRQEIADLLARGILRLHRRSAVATGVVEEKSAAQAPLRLDLSDPSRPYVPSS